MPGSGEIRKNNGLQRGDTLLEVIVAMLLLGVIILGPVPLFSYIRTHQLINGVRLIAYNLAESQLGAIKSMPFDAMGTEVDGSIVGDPPGTFLQQYPPITYPNSPGVVYNMFTQIRYKPDPSRSPDDPIKTDYKDSTVEVKTQIPGVEPALCPDIILNSMATAENEWEEMPGGNIYVAATQGTPNSNVGNMTVQLTGPQEDNPTTYQLLTDTASGDMPGEALFASLPTTDTPYSYQMTATDNNNDGMMILPSETTLTTYLSTNAPIGYLSFQVAPYFSLILNFNKAFNGTISLACADAGYDYNQTFNLSKWTTTSWNPLTGTISTNSSGITSLNITNLWPAGPSWLTDNNAAYNLTIQGASSITISDPGKLDDGQPWNGQFPNPPHNITLNAIMP